MKAVVYEVFGGPLTLQTVPDPAPPEGGAVIRVMATGLCHSDWHGWMGHDPDITALPHVPGHELAGVVAAVGPLPSPPPFSPGVRGKWGRVPGGRVGVDGWQVGDRVTVPFVCACGTCPQCVSGNHQVCERQSQPGFTHWGSFAEYVAIEHASVNLVRLPEEVDFAAAAGLGCRFGTAFRAVVDRGQVSAGEWLAVHGCGGVGLSAVMIASALGANVVAVDITEQKLAFARSVGAAATVNATEVEDVVAAVVEATGGGAHVSIDALGSPATSFNSVANLRRRGRHIQVGLLAGEHRYASLPMDRVIAHELEILGSHGMQAYRYGELLAMVRQGKLHPERLIGDRISLDEAPGALAAMDGFSRTGITVIDRF